MLYIRAAKRRSPGRYLQMKIQIVSDLHLEFTANREWVAKNHIIPIGDVLLIAGDTYCLSHPEHAASFLQRVSDDFHLIISTLGNHEFYGSNIEQANPVYRYYESYNHLVLNNQNFIYQGIRFICSVLWSHVPSYHLYDVQNGINDYRHIYKINEGGNYYPIRVEDTNALHELSYRFIEQAIAEKHSGPTILLTHHMPSYKSISPRYKNSRISSAFAANMDALIEANPQISYWFYGHAHDFHKMKINNCTLIRNPLGYVDQGEHQGFRRDYFIEI